MGETARRVSAARAAVDRLQAKIVPQLTVSCPVCRAIHAVIGIDHAQDGETVCRECRTRFVYSLDAGGQLVVAADIEPGKLPRPPLYQRGQRVPVQ